MKFDLHTHHYRCGHADGNIRDYIEAGISAGLQVIGISDHTPYFGFEEDQAFPNTAMGKSQLADYVQEVLDLKKEYAGKIDVLLGIESDYFPHHAHLYKAALDSYPFDYIIGSVHFSGGYSIFDPTRWDGLSEQEKVATKSEYFRMIGESAKSGMFHILGHIDAMKSRYPEFSDIEAPEALDDMLRTIADSGVAIEVNTSGKIKLCGLWHPIDSMLERAFHFGVEISFGSDSHVPERVGDDFELVANKLREIGYTEWVYYKQKQRQVVAL
ncbi:histidinol-phosphatase [Paenibacillus hunanensis]|uniref:histidinol-phosphatase n=1 Tax=Paenibacillus hunanensis TaxID=539262 RepID=UPI002A69E1E9|nr:histidinol-phosphatase [Paenibacillus hunanensis]WPP42367.1 histidinol-phosphatase [Paenibacillus hunanensis]